MIVEEYVSFAPKVTLPPSTDTGEVRTQVSDRLNALKAAKREELQRQQTLSSLSNDENQSEAGLFQQLYAQNLKQLRAKVASQTLTQPQTKTKPVYLPVSQHLHKNSQSPFSFRPQLSKKSLNIAARLGDPKERLTANKPKEAFHAPDTECKPHINPHSRVIDHRSHSPISRWDALYDLSKTKNEQFTPKEAVDPECTFRPKIKRENRERSGNVVSRLLDWNKEKERKLRIAQNNCAGKDLEECTFSPVLGDLDAPEEEKINKGIERFLERRQMLRRKSPREVAPSSPRDREDALNYEAAVQALHLRLQDL